MLQSRWFSSFSVVLILCSLYAWIIKPAYANVDVCENREWYLPDDYYRCFKGIANAYEVSAKPIGALEILDLWRPKDTRRDVHIDPCHPNDDGEIDDTIFWLEPDYSTNYLEQEVSVITTSSVFMFFFNRNETSASVFYGYYPNYIGAGRWGLCIDTHGMQVLEEELLQYANATLWLSHHDRLYQPTNLQGYTADNIVKLKWDGTVNEYVVHRVEENGQKKYIHVLGKQLNEEVECGKQYFYSVASFSDFNYFSTDADYDFEQYGGAHSRWAGPITIRINPNCKGGEINPEPGYPLTYTPTPNPANTPTATPTVVACGNQGNGAYLYNSNNSCYFVGSGETESIPFSPVRVELQGTGINVELCATTNGTNPCSQVNKTTSDLSWSSIFGNFRSAKVSEGFSSNCGGDFTIHEVRVYSEKHDSGFCFMMTPGRYTLPFSPKSVRFGSGFLQLDLCETTSATNPCDERHESDDDLSESSIYGSFRSAIVAYEEPHYGDLQIALVGLSEGNTKFTFLHTLYFHIH